MDNHGTRSSRTMMSYGIYGVSIVRFARCWKMANRCAEFLFKSTLEQRFNLFDYSSAYIPRKTTYFGRRSVLSSQGTSYRYHWKLPCLGSSPGGCYPIALSLFRRITAGELCCKSDKSLKSALWDRILHYESSSPLTKQHLP